MLLFSLLSHFLGGCYFPRDSFKMLGIQDVTIYACHIPF